VLRIRWREEAKAEGLVALPNASQIELELDSAVGTLKGREPRSGEAARAKDRSDVVEKREDGDKASKEGGRKEGKERRERSAPIRAHLSFSSLKREGGVLTLSLFLVAFRW